MTLPPMVHFRSPPLTIRASNCRRVTSSSPGRWEPSTSAAAWVNGQFRDLWEYAGVAMGLPSDRANVAPGQLFRVNRAPYSGAFTPYTAGMTGWVPMVQTVLAF